MRHCTPHRGFAASVALMRRGFWLLMASSPILVATIGCQDGELGMFLTDVKNFYLNGGLTANMEGDEASVDQDELSEEDLLLEEEWSIEEARDHWEALQEARPQSLEILATQGSAEQDGSDDDMVDDIEDEELLDLKEDLEAGPRD